MFLICLLLIGLIAVAIYQEQQPSTVEKAESIPVPVWVESKNLIN